MFISKITVNIPRELKNLKASNVITNLSGEKAGEIIKQTFRLPQKTDYFHRLTGLDVHDKILPSHLKALQKVWQQKIYQ